MPPRRERRPASTSFFVSDGKRFLIRAVQIMVLSLITYVVPFFNDVCSFDILVAKGRSLNGSGRLFLRRFIFHFAYCHPLLRVQADDESKAVHGASCTLCHFMRDHGRGFLLLVEGADYKGEDGKLSCLFNQWGSAALLLPRRGDHVRQAREELCNEGHIRIPFSERMGSDISKPFGDDYMKKKGGGFDSRGFPNSEMQNSIPSFRAGLTRSEDCSSWTERGRENLFV